MNDAETNLDKAQKAYDRSRGFRTDAQFRDDPTEKTIKLRQAMVEMLEALYFQNQEMLEKMSEKEKTTG